MPKLAKFLQISVKCLKKVDIFSDKFNDFFSDMSSIFPYKSEIIGIKIEEWIQAYAVLVPEIIQK